MLLQYRGRGMVVVTMRLNAVLLEPLLSGLCVCLGPVKTKQRGA